MPSSLFRISTQWGKAGFELFMPSGRLPTLQWTSLSLSFQLLCWFIWRSVPFLDTFVLLFLPYCRNAVFFFLMLRSHRAFSSFLKARQMRSAHCVHIQTRRGVAFFFLYFFASVYKLMSATYGWKRLGAKSLSGANSCLKVHCLGWCDRRLRVRQLKQRCNESKCKMFIF